MAEKRLVPKDSEREKNISSQKNALVGFLSQINYGSPGFRKALLDKADEIFRQEGVHFKVLAGGLVSKQALTQKMREYMKEHMDDTVAETKAEKIKELEEKFLKNVAKELSAIIPTTTIADPENSKKEKIVDFFIVTSPAFDGEIGERVAHLLADLRSDIRVWNSGGDRFPVLYVDKLIWVLTPTKGVWMRGDYYSTSAERVIKDKIKQTTQSMPDLFVVGCFASGIQKEKGELPFAYVTVPACHRLEETRVSENQVGVSILEYSPSEARPLYRIHDFKDLVSQELSFIVPPEGATSLQKKMIGVMKSRGLATPGIFKYSFGIGVQKITQTMKALMELETFRKIGENWPGIIYQEQSKKYYFNLPWIQRWLKYGRRIGECCVDRVVSLCCVHAGSIETDYQFFMEKLPEIILKTGAKIVVCAGDIKEGTEHDLGKKGEIIPGMDNNTIQEKFAHNMFGGVFFKVFEDRFKAFLGTGYKERLTGEKLSQAIEECLVDFEYWFGNHDLWETKHGHEPLEVFHLGLVMFLTEHIVSFLESNELQYPRLNELVASKIHRNNFFYLPSGLKVSIQHPHMARAKTTSIRPQEMLDYGRRFGCQVTIGGNFHVSETVFEWNKELGQCVCQEIGTIKHGSNFERNKMKMVDQGIGFLKISSVSNLDPKNKKRNLARITSVESAFYGEPKIRPPVDNLSIINAFLKSLNVEPIKRL